MKLAFGLYGAMAAFQCWRDHPSSLGWGVFGMAIFLAALSLLNDWKESK